METENEKPAEWALDRPIKVLDLFCCSGGAAVGYEKAFGDAEITGIDHVFKKEYPYNFIKADIVDFIQETPIGWFREFDFIHASPPCQIHSRTKELAKAQGNLPSDVDYISSLSWSGIGVVFEDLILSTTAHELGHMTSLPHIECNNETNEPAQPQASGIDDFYPYNSSPIGNGSTNNTTGGGDDFGRIGKVGYDFRNGNYVSKTLYHDIMSYCTRQWISDYHYKKLYDFQQQLDNYFHPGSSPLIVGNESSISNPYVRKVARTLSSQNPVSNKVTYFNGIVQTDGSFRVLNTSFLTRKIIPLVTGEYEYVVQSTQMVIYGTFFVTCWHTQYFWHKTLNCLYVL